MLNGEFLVAKNLVTQADLDKAIEIQTQKRIPIGNLAVENKFLTEKQLVVILKTLREYKNSPLEEKRSKRFGDVSIELHILNPDEVDEIKRIQDSRTPLIGNVLVQMGILSAREFVKALKEFKQIYS